MAGAQMTREPAGRVGAGCQVPLPLVAGSGDSWGLWRKGWEVWLRAKGGNYALRGVEYQC